jgi:hypothetical protein
MQKPKPGDLVEVVWRDHFRYQGDDLPEPLEVRSWGLFDLINDDGVAIVQNEVQTGGDPHIERCMDSQFILAPNIVDIVVLTKRKTARKVEER